MADDPAAEAALKQFHIAPPPWSARPMYEQRDDFWAVLDAKEMVICANLTKGMAHFIASTPMLAITGITYFALKNARIEWTARHGGMESGPEFDMYQQAEFLGERTLRDAVKQAVPGALP